MAGTRVAVDSELATWLRAQAWPEDFDRATRHVMEGAGKAVRPALVFAVAETLSGNSSLSSSSVRRLSLAIELMHTYSLVHDDLPAMDDDAFRRGRPTLHVLWNDAFAVLAGDALLTASFQCLGEAFSSEPEKIARALAVLSRAAGVPGMIGGQWLDMSSEGRTGLSMEILQTIHFQKTGALLAASALLGALKTLSLAEFVKIENEMEKWGQDLGLLFQMVDDLLDATATRAVLGKTPGKDAAQSKFTYVSQLGKDELTSRIRKLSKSLQAPRFVAESALLSQLVTFIADRSS
ncbi:MAG: polyprenyl synthetase family protein [Bdellovibrionota bacterium]